MIPFRSDLKIDGVDPFKYNKLTYLNQICFNGWMVNSTHNESKIQSFKSFGHNASVFVSNNDTIVVKSIIESSFKNYGVILKAKVEIKDEQNQIVSFFKIP